MKYNIKENNNRRYSYAASNKTQTISLEYQNRTFEFLLDDHVYLVLHFMSKIILPVTRLTKPGWFYFMNSARVKPTGDQRVLNVPAHVHNLARRVLEGHMQSDVSREQPWNGRELGQVRTWAFEINIALQEWYNTMRIIGVLRLKTSPEIKNTLESVVVVPTSLILTKLLPLGICVWRKRRDQILVFFADLVVSYAWRKFLEIFFFLVGSCYKRCVWAINEFIIDTSANCW